MERGCHATWIQTHSAEAAGSDCVLQGPLAACEVSSWYVIVGSALPAVRNSPFCETALLNHLNEALMDGDVDWTRVSPCGSCHAAGADSVFSDAAVLCSSLDDGLASWMRRRCLVFGEPSAWSHREEHLGNLCLRFSALPPFPDRGSVLHDGDPCYQRQLFFGLMFSLHYLRSGDVLLLPVFSALTRVTAAAVLCLHVCFRSVTFRCPPPSGEVGALLVCAGFCPDAAARILPFLTDLLERMARLEAEANARETASLPRDRQVLQLVPMEDMLSRGLTEFLHHLNSKIIRHKLHLLMQA